MRSLQARVVAVGVVGAVLVAAVTTALALPLVRSVARDEARSQLVRATDTLAARPQATRRLLRAEQSVLGPDARTFRAIRPGRPVPADLAQALDDDAADAVRAGRSWSGTSSVDGAEVIVEVRPSRGGVTVVGLQPVDGLDAIDAAFVRRLLVALLVGTAVAVAVALVVARRAVRPVRQTAAVARRLASGERDVEPARTGVTEVAEVSSALAHLDAALSRSEGRQREFLLSVSHELRTPLTALQGYAEALRDGAVDTDRVGEVGQVLVDHTARLERFVADLLSLARLEADDFSIEPSTVDVLDVARRVVTTWSAVAQRRGVALEARSSTTVRAWTDPQRLGQLLDGLVENALRATPGGGRVDLVVDATTDGAVVAVMDDGPGLGEGAHERAFERGYLRDRHAADRSVGTGLGLSIAQGLARRLGAELVARPGAADGTVMELTLPRDVG